MGSKVFWAGVFGFLSGVFARSFLPLGWSFAGLSALLGAVALASAFFEGATARRSVLIALALFSCAGGIARMQVATLSGDPELTANIGQQVALEGIVSEEPDARDSETLVSLKASGLVAGTSAVPVSAGVLATLPPNARVAYGDIVRVSGKLQLPQAFATGEDREFDYPTYLGAQGIGYELGYASIEDISGNAGNSLKAFAIAAKEKFLEGLRRAMPDPQAALAGGITVGDKRSIGPELTEDFQRDSLVHMVVLSGYNITVVLNAVARLLAWAPRGVQFGGGIFTVAFFVLMSGGASSATRAGLMAILAVFARQTRRVYLGERSLAAVSFAMVAWNPWTLCFDPSFQLSALATLGLVLFTPIFSGWFSRVPERFGLREILASTCATQLMVLPLLLYQDGMLSLVALPANVLALVPVPVAMFFSLVAGVGGMLFGGAGAALAFPAYALLSYITSVAHLIASVPFAAVSIPGFAAAWMFGAYAVLFGGFFMLQKKQRGSPKASRAVSQI